MSHAHRFANSEAIATQPVSPWIPTPSLQFRLLGRGALGARRAVRHRRGHAQAAAREDAMGNSRARGGSDARAGTAGVTLPP